MAAQAFELILPSPGWIPPSKTHFYLFDLDGTLVASRSGKPIAADAADIVFFHGVEETIHNLLTAGHTLLIVSNQAIWTAAIRSKIQAAVERLQIPAIVATGKTSPYRKPAANMWHKFLMQFRINMAGITDVNYTGDAVGADDPWPAYRWSDSDKRFAETIQATFHRPKDFFPQWDLASVAPKKRTMFIMMGTPGSGKTTIGDELSGKYRLPIFEQDRWRTRDKFLKDIRKELEESNDSIIVDATHSNRDRREELYSLARIHDMDALILWSVRDGRPFNATRRKPVPAVAYGVYMKNFADPLKDNVAVVVVS